MSTALLSVFNKTDAFREFARGLHERGIDLLASGGTKKFLDQAGIPSRDVADIVGEPIFGHRVVTLSREVYASILARHWDDSDMQELERLGLPKISLVYVDLYPLAQAIGDVSKDRHAVREMIDIGGPTLLRAAAKAELVVVTKEDQFRTVLGLMSGKAFWPKIAFGVRSHLIHSAERIVAEYTDLTAKYYKAIADSEFEKFRQAYVPKA